MESVARGWRGGAAALRAKAIRVAVAAVMALAMVPAVAVQQALAAQPTFVGSVYYPVAYDENGYPLYNEDGTFQRGNPYVSLENVENASGTLVVPASFDVVVREGATEKVERNVTPAILNIGGRVYIPGVGEGGPNWTNSAITSIDLTQCASVESVSFDELSSVESVDLSGLPSLRTVRFEDCGSLRLASMVECTQVSGYSLSGCDNLPLPDFSQSQWRGLENVQIFQRSDLVSLDASVLPELNYLTISRCGLADIDVSRCTKLKNLDLSNNQLTRLEVAGIPDSVERLYCRNNSIVDTKALVERFGENAVLPQNTPTADSGLVVIGERDAQGIMVPGENWSFGLGYTYHPSMSESNSYYQENEADRNAATNFSASSSDHSVAAVEIVDEGNPQLRVNALKAGTTTLTINYSFTGVSDTYTGQQVIDFTVAQSANPIVSVSCVPSVDVPFVSDCAIDHKSHHTVGGGIMVPLEITAQDASRVLTGSAHVEVEAADASVVNGSFEVEPAGMESEYAVRLNPYKIGSTVVTLTGVTQVNGQEVRTDPVTVQVNVVESATPKLQVEKSHTAVYYSGGGMSVAIVGSNKDGGPTAIASYVEDEALEQMVQWHNNGFTYGNAVATDNGEVQVVTAVSDNEAVASVSYEHGARLDIKGPGTARVTVSDVWGNSGVCTVTVLDRAAEAQKLSLKQSELTLKVGEALDLATVVQGLDDVDPWLTSGVEFLVFRPSNGFIAPIKFSEDGKRNVSMLLARNVGDVTVTAGVLTGNDMGGSLDYIDQWETTDFGTLTVHVVSADTPTNPATAVEVTGASHTLEMGSALQLSASITPVDADNADTLAWTSSNEGVATVDATGKVAPVAPGTATITAKVGSASGTFEVTVVEHAIPATAVTISTADDAMEVGDTQRLAATVEPANSTDAVEWFSADEKVLTVDQSGLVTAVGNGTTAIGVRAGAVKDETRAITVTTPVKDILLDATKLELYVGASPSKLTASIAPATASNKAVTWSSSDEGVATVDADGNVAPVAVGTAVVTATTDEGGYKASCTVEVKQHAKGVALDKHALTLTGAEVSQLKATVAPDNATNKNVVWASSDESVVTVDGDGEVVSVAKGEATITATTQDGGFSDTCTVTVRNPAVRFELDPLAMTLVKGETGGVVAVPVGMLPGEVDSFDEAVSWSSSNEAVATVSDGTVTAVATGFATIKAEAAVGSSNVTGTCNVFVTNPVRSVALSETSKTVAVGDPSFALAATVTPADADDPSVTWASSNPAVATVDADGGVTIVAAGSANIVASAGGKSAACALTVKAKEIAQTPQGSGFTASVTATDSETVKALEQLAGDGGLNLVVDGIAQLTASAKEAVEKLTADGAMVADAFDIHFTDDRGQEIVLSKDDGGRVVLTVRVKLTDSMRSLLDQGMRLQVHYVGEDGTVEDKETWLEGDYLCFTTEHFSNYVVTGVPTSGEPASDGPRLLAAADGGSSLAPTGDPTRPAALAIGALACLAGAAAMVVRHRKNY